MVVAKTSLDYQVRQKSASSAPRVGTRVRPVYAHRPLTRDPGFSEISAPISTWLRLCIGEQAHLTPSLSYVTYRSLKLANVIKMNNACAVCRGPAQFYRFVGHRRLLTLYPPILAVHLRELRTRKQQVEKLIWRP